MEQLFGVSFYGVKRHPIPKPERESTIENNADRNPAGKIMTDKMLGEYFTRD